MENKQMISNFISSYDYSFHLFINTRTGKILAPLLNYSNIYFPVMLYNFILYFYPESKKEKK